MLYARLAVHSEVAIVHLIEHCVLLAGEEGSTVVLPAGRVRLAKVDDGATLAVHAYSVSRGAGILLKPFAVFLDLECIELAFVVAGQQSYPLVAYILLVKSERTEGCAALTVGVDVHFY